jgi:malate dehydrogenase (oxaloacetate-decarboxylating)
MEDREVFAREAVAVGMKAQEQGLARVARDAETLYQHAAGMIARARALTASMMAEGFIEKPPETEVHDA